MTHRPGDSFVVQRCNQCRGPRAIYCAALDEYLCETCEEYALAMEAIRQEMEKLDASVIR